MFSKIKRAPKKSALFFAEARGINGLVFRRFFLPSKSRGPKLGDPSHESSGPKVWAPKKWSARQVCVCVLLCVCVRLLSFLFCEALNPPHTQTHTHTHTLPFIHTPTQRHTHPHTHTHCLSFTHRHKDTHPHPHTHTHTLPLIHTAQHFFLQFSRSIIKQQ